MLVDLQIHRVVFSRWTGEHTLGVIHRSPQRTFRVEVHLQHRLMMNTALSSHGSRRLVSAS